MSYYKDGYFWRTTGHEWEVRNYGDHVHGKGDLIYNSCAKIVKDKDTSEWAIQSVYECYRLLSEGKRWPDRMSQRIDAKTQIGHWVSLLLFWFKFTDKVKYRPQHDMTRDPYIAFFAACVFLNISLIPYIKIPWYLYRPHVWRWRKRLVIDKRKPYVRELGYLMAFATANK